ncbi:hypothetical protein FOZ62_010818, partial [Perkinsus olseni]
SPPPPKGSPRSPYVFRTSEQVARLLNLKCEMKSWIACPHPDLATAAIVLTFGPSQLKSLQELIASDSMRVGFGLRLAVTQRHEIRTLRQIFSSLLHFGICCGMLLSGNWIHVGGKANRLAMAEVLSPDKSTAGSCTVGASMLTVAQCVPEQGETYNSTPDLPFVGHTADASVSGYLPSGQARSILVGPGGAVAPSLRSAAAYD